jgi:transcriptional regulator with XRE-family HTH domain
MGRNSIPGLSSRNRELRESTGWTRDQLAVAAGTSSHRIARLEQGVRALSLELARRVAQAFGYSLDDLVRPSTLAAPPAQAARRKQK